MNRIFTDKSDYWAGGFLLFVIGIVLVGAVGWVRNIIALVGMESFEPLGMFVVRIIGIFIAPLGAILGYL